MPVFADDSHRACSPSSLVFHFVCVSAYFSLSLLILHSGFSTYSLQLGSSPEYWGISSIGLFLKYSCLRKSAVILLFEAQSFELCPGPVEVLKNARDLKFRWPFRVILAPLIQNTIHDFPLQDTSDPRRPDPRRSPDRPPPFDLEVPERLQASRDEP